MTAETTTFPRDSAIGHRSAKRELQNLQMISSSTTYGYIYCNSVATKQQGSHYILVLKFKDFSRIFKDQFSTEVYSMDGITAIFNVGFCDYGTVLVDKNKTRQLLANLVLGKIYV